MKVGIYIGSSGSAVGGADLYAAVLAEAMAPLHRVEIIQHNTSLTRQELGGFAGVDLNQVRLLCVERKKNPFGHSIAPWSRYRDARAWSSDLSAPYDLFINFTHLMPAFCHAPRGILVVLFPWFDRHAVWPFNNNGSKAGFLRDRLLQTYYDWEWQKRFSTYQCKVAISDYTKKWTKQWWGIDSEVIYPPIDTHAAHCKKKIDLILSVGRFTTDGHSKKQLEMVNSFSEISAHMPGWKYRCVGGLSSKDEDRAYLETVRRSSSTCAVRVDTNLNRGVLEELYGEAKIFWHAAGYGEDEKTHPELQEHFGITTVEAMAAGCVPVVVDRGGQPEVVEHGVSGFVWTTLDELKKYTLRLVDDEPLRTRMAEAARQRSRLFSKEHFVQNFLRLI